MASLAAINRKMYKAAGVIAAQHRKLIAARAASQVADGAAQSERVKALSDLLASDRAAQVWSSWASRRLAEDFAARYSLEVSMRDAYRDTGGKGADSDIILRAVAEQGAARRHSKYLLSVAYGADAARREAMREWMEDHEEMTEVSDDPERASYLKARREAISDAVKATTAHLTDPEPRCNETTRGAVALLALILDSRLLASLPKTIKVSMMLPDAIRKANTFLPESAQANVETVATLEVAARR